MVCRSLNLLDEKYFSCCYHTGDEKVELTIHPNNINDDDDDKNNGYESISLVISKTYM